MGYGGSRYKQNDSEGNYTVLSALFPALKVQEVAFHQKQKQNESEGNYTVLSALFPALKLQEVAFHQKQNESEEVTLCSALCFPL